MGLDQYAGIRKADGTTAECAYWRKHPNLQGWMERLYRQKGGAGEFNCVDVELTAEDIDQLEKDVIAGALPGTSGFFFGSDADAHYREADLRFISAARSALAEGHTVVYTSWW